MSIDGYIKLQLISNGHLLIDCNIFNVVRIRKKNRCLVTSIEYSLLSFCFIMNNAISNCQIFSCH